MKISINKNALLAQLPNGDVEDWPSVIELKGTPVEEYDDPLENRYPVEYSRLTMTQWLFFRELVKHGTVRTEDLFHLCPSSDWLTQRTSAAKFNIVHVHMYQLKRKLRDLYAVRSRKGFGFTLTKA